MRNARIYRIIVYLALIIACLIMGGCGTRHKEKSRVKQSLETSSEKASISINQKDSRKDSIAYAYNRQQIIEWLREFEVEVVDNTRSGDVDFTPKEDGGFNVGLNNTKFTGKQKTTKTESEDSTAAKVTEVDKGKIESAEKEETELDRSSNEMQLDLTSKRSFISIGIGLAVFVIIIMIYLNRASIIGKVKSFFKR